MYPWILVSDWCNAALVPWPINFLTFHIQPNSCQDQGSFSAADVNATKISMHMLHCKPSYTAPECEPLATSKECTLTTPYSLHVDLRFSCISQALSVIALTAVMVL